MVIIIVFSSFVTLNGLKPVIDGNLVRIHAWAHVSQEADSTQGFCGTPSFAIPERKWNKGGKPTDSAGTSKEPPKRLQNFPPRGHKEEVLI